MTELNFITLESKKLHKSNFLQHIRDMQYVEIKGELTLNKLREVLNSHFEKHNPKLLDAAKAWCDVQLENPDQVVTEQTVVIPSDEDDRETAYFIHFDVIS